jgi:hypothetical protein
LHGDKRDTDVKWGVMVYLQISPAGQTVLGVYSIIVGLVMIILHKDVKQWNDDWYEHLPPIIWRPTGTLLTVMIIVFGVLSILIGFALLILALVPPTY